MSKVKRIRRRPFAGDVFNLAVADDETYFAGGILVHNCRSLVIAIDFEDWRPELATRRRPDIAPQEGFGVTGGQPFA